MLSDPSALVEEFRTRYAERCDMIWGQGTKQSVLAFELEIEKLRAFRELLRRLGTMEVQRRWEDLKRIFYDAKACPFCCISMRPVTKRDDLDEDERPVVRDGANYFIACAECPVGLMARMRDYSYENGCHRQPEYKSLKHARGDLRKALRAVDASINVMLRFQEILTIKRSFKLDGE